VLTYVGSFEMEIFDAVKSGDATAVGNILKANPNKINVTDKVSLHLHA
jgi:hypothetical protein